MSKYKVGDELIIVSDPNKEADKLKELTTLSVDVIRQAIKSIKDCNIIL